MSEITILDELNEINLFLKKFGDFQFAIIAEEPESKDYHALKLKISNKSIIYRTAKITPTKVGQFVTIWKRNAQKITAPYAFSDEFNFFYN
jgi:hypothetical protein